jgi:SOS-response transcriptional repressor LexA
MRTVNTLSAQALRQIKKLMQSRGMQAKDFAASLGLSKSYFSDIQHGRRKPSREVMERLQRVYGFTPDESDPASETTSIELYMQEAGAGPGIEIANYQQGKHIGVPLSMLGPHRPDDIKAVIVKGDSLIDEHIYNGDYVLFNLKDTEVATHNGGIYVVAVDNTLFVKHVAFLPDETRLMSANQAAASLYPDRIFQGEKRNQVRIAGKVIAWIHYDE